MSIEAKSKYMDKAKETRRKNTYVDLIIGLLAWIKTCKDIFGQNCHMRRNVVKSFMDQGILSEKLE